jgi:DNA-binding response OmpR family regulator
VGAERTGEVGSGERVRVLIGEPFAPVRELLERAVSGLGHEALTPGPDWEGQLPDVDVLVLEPSYEEGVALARALRRLKPELPVICAYGLAPDPSIEDLEPVAYLAKPFALAELERALTEAARRAVRDSHRP